jgi:GNAT superfamily N-acetyltransferase
MPLAVSLSDSIDEDEVVALYKANAWSSAEKPQQLLAALRNSDALVTARVDGRLVGLGNAISDRHLVVYFPHMLVHPEFQRQGVGRALMGVLMQKYDSFHQQMRTADG